MHVALAAPERVTRLVLVSSTRVSRTQPSELGGGGRPELADELERVPFEGFIERWRTQPLFADDPPQVGELAREDQRRNRPEALAGVMRGIGTGEMQPLWGRLGELKMPVTVVAGDRDAKFQALGERMVGLLGDARLLAIRGGHGLPFESPAELARAID